MARRAGPLPAALGAGVRPVQAAATLRPAHLGFGPGRLPGSAHARRWLRGPSGGGRGRAEAVCPECPAPAIHSEAAGVRATPAGSETGLGRGAAGTVHFLSPSLRDQTWATRLGSWRAGRTALRAEGGRGAGAGAAAAAAVPRAGAPETRVVSCRPAGPVSASPGSSLPAPEWPSGSRLRAWE